MQERNFVVTVKEDGAGQPWLLFELHEDIGLGKTLFAMHFEQGTPIEHAQGVARSINSQVSKVGLHSTSTPALAGGHYVDQINRALYQQMRFFVLATTIPDRNGSPFSDAYLYAWDRGVYPLHDGAEWHQPHEEQFRVREAEIDELNRFLAERWDGGKPTSFYELERHYDVQASGPWDRSKLIGACRYMFLHNLFDDRFWHAVTQRGECPVEAQSITDSKADVIYFQ